jgi:hypothetical protein
VRSRPLRVRDRPDVTVETVVETVLTERLLEK